MSEAPRSDRFPIGKIFLAVEIVAIGTGLIYLYQSLKNPPLQTTIQGPAQTPLTTPTTPPTTAIPSGAVGTQGAGPEYHQRLMLDGISLDYGQWSTAQIAATSQAYGGPKCVSILQQAGVSEATANQQCTIWGANFPPTVAVTGAALHGEITPQQPAGTTTDSTKIGVPGYIVVQFIGGAWRVVWDGTQPQEPSGTVQTPGV